jgi:hypothetical protein
MTLRLSVLEMPFMPADGLDSGEPTAEEVWEVAGDERGLSGTRASRWAVTVAMVGGRGWRGREGRRSRDDGEGEEAANAERAEPVEMGEDV